MLQSINVLVMDVALFRADDVFKVLDVVGEPRALFQLQGNSGFAEAVQHRVNIFDVLFRVRGEENDIVQVEKAYLSLQAT